jgi:beta-glucanase (GH16 family)
MSEETANFPLSRRDLLVASSLAAITGALSACGGGAKAKPQPSNAPEIDTSTPDAQDPLDFSGQPDGSVDRKVWRFETDPKVPGYNNEAQIYTRDHAKIKNHTLVIDAIKTATGYASSRIDTRDTFSFTYGTITARAKLPKGVGTWPAIWLLPVEGDTPKVLKKYGIPVNTDDDYYYSYGGEIDILETVGAEDKPVNNQPTAHTYKSRVAGPTGASTAVVKVPDGQEKFHDYGLRKTPGLLEFTLDGKVVHRFARKAGDDVHTWPYDDYHYYVLANLAMGGTWGGERNKEFPPDGIDDSQAPWQFEIAALHFEAA